MQERYGWRKINKDNATVWIKESLTGLNIKAIYSQLLYLRGLGYSDIHTILSWLKNLKGNFAFVIEFTEYTIVAVDKINSIPLFYLETKDEVIVGNNAKFIKDHVDTDKWLVNIEAAKEIAMSGYTIGRKTLFHNLYQLTAGECLLISECEYKKYFYYTYSPWKVLYRSENKLKDQFSDVLQVTMSDLAKSVYGRQVVVPLSAGYDSRLIASGLKKFGVKDVLCISYGRKGNYESLIAQQVAEKLGFKWKHILISDATKKLFFLSEKYEKYKNDFESYSSIPAVQDVVEICYLKRNKIIENDAILINGSGGDYITGGHVLDILDYSKNNNMWNLFLNKHYSLWSKLRTTDNDLCIIDTLKSAASARGIETPSNITEFSALYESLEYLGRQSKYVLNQQRSYDFNGYEWLAPLWSENFLDFWEKVPLSSKIRQKLYIDTLLENNWGNVWQDVPVNKAVIQPSWVLPLRTISKFAFIPFGKSIWHQFERNAFQYWMDVTRNNVIVPYRRVLFDTRGQKNIFSWLSEIYLEESAGVDLNSLMRVKR